MSMSCIGLQKLNEGDWGWKFHSTQQIVEHLVHKEHYNNTANMGKKQQENTNMDTVNYDKLSISMLFLVLGLKKPKSEKSRDQRLS